ncbi:MULTISPECIES: 4-(cytidine 5'-diphospho)-2-C-methyl-D-erythritol kinase [unclassified Thioalkalivibrio]|uniref:4-(cytidine 5'-diphospho)-2-C-methyl-D-erythritol kinase n=1 Tax=unclassified Thioalkalivibrio TaxID=2621013 RepID=UPI0003A85583|nr:MULTISPECIES: 4-(cytidine 5'-diphospho)-2-C-methyl-D-erythritol kinase [unclassified Thioalkalivibrio]
MSGDFDVAFPAPAKINRFLHITGRRPDGYHELQSVFQFVGLADSLRFESLEQGRFEMSTEGVDGDNNLCLRAARALADAAGSPFGVRVHLDKCIPIGGGLGGGSSDAATTLVALNHLFDLGLSEDKLAAIGLGLGADVPVFVRGRAAWAEGVGDRLVPVEPDLAWLLLLDPGVSVATGPMFGAAELTRDCPAETISPEIDAARFRNVFEPLVRRQYPAIGEALDWMGGQTERVRLSGTGGCIFGMFPNEAAARQAQAAQPRPWRSWVTPLANVSPLRQWLPRSAAADEGAEQRVIGP